MALGAPPCEGNHFGQPFGRGFLRLIRRAQVAEGMGVSGGPCESPGARERAPCRSQSHPPCGLESIILHTTGRPYGEDSKL